MISYAAAAPRVPAVARGEGGVAEHKEEEDPEEASTGRGEEGGTRYTAEQGRATWKKRIRSNISNEIAIFY